MAKFQGPFCNSNIFAILSLGSGTWHCSVIAENHLFMNRPIYGYIDSYRVKKLQINRARARGRDLEASVRVEIFAY